MRAVSISTFQGGEVLFAFPLVELQKRILDELRYGWLRCRLLGIWPGERVRCCA
jgi:hypothetical protein